MMRGAESDGAVSWLTSRLRPAGGLLRASLMSYGLVAFLQHPLPALLVLLATFFHPYVGLMGLLGALTSNLIARWMAEPHATWRTGMHGMSGLLVGLAVTMNTDPSTRVVVFVLFGAAVAGVLSSFLASALAKYDLPILSLPMMLLAWPILMGVGVDPVSTHAFPSLPLLRELDLWLFEQLPLPLFKFFSMFGSILFQQNLISGVLVLLAIALTSRISLLYALWGGLLGLGAYGYLHGSLDGFQGLNYVLTALALGGFFVVANGHGFLFATLAILTVGLVDYSAYQFLNPPVALTVSNMPSALVETDHRTAIPTLVFAFNTVTLAFLYPLKIAYLDQRSTRLIPVPLTLIRSPEANLRWARRWRSSRYIQLTMLTLPFMGRWSVLQGHNGRWTHKGRGRYAWDFVIRDDEGHQHRGDGGRLEDYYCWSLPVLAPAPGRVIAVENSVPDNPPGSAQTERNWGNYLLLDHGNGEVSLLAHFKQKSISVRSGDSVERGQVLGQCGNSGRSQVPHIHYQLQYGAVPGGISLPAVLSEAVVDGEISANVQPEPGSRVEPVEITPQAQWHLLGRETERWVFECRVGLRRFTETLEFTTDDAGLPAVRSGKNHLWYLLEKPSFAQFSPDFKTFPTLLEPSGWLRVVGESLILPRMLREGLRWQGGEVLDHSGDRWTLQVGERVIVLDSARGVVLEASLPSSSFRFRLLEHFPPSDQEK